ncbi:efflux RND transporter permease subunit [Methylophaga thiooxydans]|uniref:RND transporter, HAE1/HME family, permease protein n=1 Tax=Methylophaga thiooxydans DMS010 TaxID=637616 RepID=C0N5D9_9GAMM|nr:efflux RND transporter permease subunit [Methylophaga thiooxydans]EEF79926.1 RND transporter, HAE1/HME family, permease protein [Methylophaga thiooxydans DMS010]
MLEAPIKNGKLLTVIVLIIVVLGIAAAQRIPVQMIPDLDVRTISVVTGWPGATPQDVEKEILIEQERYLRSVPNMTRMESTADTGQANIEMEFPFGVDINETLIEVTNALSQVSSYPENVDQPTIRSSSFSENAFMYFAVATQQGNPLNLDMDMVTDFIDDDVRPRMERVRGVSEVQLRGGAERQVQITIDPAKLAQRGLSLTDVRDAIRERNRDTSAGDLDDGKRRYFIRTTGRFKDIESLNELTLAHRNNTDIKLKDVAEVKLDHYEVRHLAIVNDEAALMMAVKRESGSNVINIKRDMLKVVEEIRQEQLEPNGMTIKLIGDDVRYVQASVEKVASNLALGAILATLVLFLFLRSGRATLIGLMGMPICTIAAFIGLLVFDRTINVISLAGIAFAIGMTVDNTIVVLESIEQARRRGLDRIQAAITGVRDVWSAVLASSMTTVLVFAPVLFVQEEAGQLYSDIAIAISTAILASMLFALAVVPAACARVGFGDERDHGDDLAHPGPILRTVSWLNGSAIKRFLCIVLIFSGTMIAGWYLMPPAEYLPEGEEPKAFSVMTAPPGYNLSEMEKLGDEIRDHLRLALNADPSKYDNGEHQIPSLKYYFQRIMPGRVWVLSEPTRDQDIEPMMQALTDLYKQYPGMRGFSHRGSIIASNQGGTRAVNLDISGADQGSLYRTAENAMRRAESIFGDPQIESEPSALSLDQPLIEVRPNWDRLAEIDMTADDFGYTVAALSDGAYVGEFFMEDDKIDMFIFSTAGQNQTLSDMSDLPIMTPQGTVLPLSALAEIRDTVDSDQLRRVDGRRTVTLSVIPPREIALETAVNRVRTQMLPDMQAAGEVDKGVSISISGAADQLDATRESLSSNMVIAVILIYLLLVAIFSHWGYPLLILTTVPLGIAGGIVGLVAVNSSGALLNAFGLPAIIQPFDMITMLGFVILLGTVVNNPILIVEQTRKNLQEAGTSVRLAVNRAVATRLRPILMSTATTVFGLAPLVFIPGAGTELYRGVGIVVLVGILCSMIVTLAFLPSLLISVLSWNEKRKKQDA